MSYENATIGCLRTTLLILAIASWSHAHGQVYFEGLYGENTSAEGVGIGGVLPFPEGYLVWGGAYGQQRFSTYPFVVGPEGELLNELTIITPDTISDQPGNVLTIGDNIYLGMSYQLALTEPAETRGDMALTKFNAEGEVFWRRVQGDTGRIEIPQRVIACSDHGYAITGQINTGTLQDGNGMVCLVRVDSLGLVIWERLYGGTLYDSGQDLVQTPDGGFLILGWTRSFGAGERDFYLVKTDSLGEQQWQRTYGGGGSESGASIMSLSNGNYLLSGGGTDDGVTSRGQHYEVSPAGDVVWHEKYASGPSPKGYFFRSIQLPDGSIVSCGLAENTGTGGNAGWILKTTATGEMLWQRVYDKNQYTDLFYSVLLAEDGGFLLSGQAWNTDNSSQDAWLLKVDSVGCAYPHCITGVDEVEPTKIMVDVWPNPTTDFFNIEFQQQGVAEVHLYDMAGKLLFQKQTTQLREVIDVSALESGLYLLSVLQGDMKTTMKVMVW